MGGITYFSVTLIGLLLVIGLIWRLYSRRQSLPCPSWLGWMVELDNPFTRTNRAHVIIGHLGVLPGMQILDAGCGPGRLAIPLAEKLTAKGSVTAVDIQAAMLQRVRRRAEEQKLHNIEFVQAALGEGHLDKGRYDRAVLVTVLGEIPDQESAMRELYTALKPGGVLSITEVIFDPHFQIRGKLRALAVAAGFQEQGFYGHRLAYTLQLIKPAAVTAKGG